MDRKWWTLVAVCTATFMLLLDITVVNVALPAIERDLRASFTDLQWVIDAYALSLAALLLTGGSLADRIGRRRVFVIGLGVFTVASALCGLAGTPLVLNLSRALQGVGGAFMFATSLALIASTYQGRDRGTAFGMWGATTGAAVAIGPLVGGVLTEAIGWEAIFFVNLPIGAFAIALTLARVHESKDPTGHRLDLLGTVLFSGGLFCLIFGLIRGNPEGWSSPIIVGALAGAALLLLAFVVVEARSHDPMLDLTLFGRPAFAGASIAAFVLSAAMFAMFLYLTLYLQNVLGYSPLETGVRFLPLSVTSFVVAPFAGRLAARYPVRAFLGLGLVLVSLALLLMHGVTPHSHWTTLLAGFVIGGAGIGMVNPALAQGAVGVVQPQMSGVASGINNTCRQVGIATGIAALGAIFQGHIQSKLVTGLAGTPGEGRVHELARGIAGGGAQQIKQGVPPQFRGRFTAVADTAFCSGLNTILIVGAGLALAGALLSFALVRERDFVSGGAVAEAAHA